MEKEDLRPVEVYLPHKNERYRGYFLEFSKDSEQGQGSWPIAIIETEDGQIKHAYIDFVKFLDR